MKIFYAVFILLLLQFSANTQTVIVSGECMSSAITLSSISDINGKPAYQGTGTVDGIPNVTVSVYWLGVPDNLWVLDFDGQPYFQNACDFDIPPGTGATCPWDVVSGTTCTGGTPLAITGAVALPIRLISFTASKTNNHVLLNWKAATETNNKGFEVQRSSDGNNWITIGFVTGGGNSFSESTYHYIDNTPLERNNYYRLIQYDINNNPSYFPVVRIDFKNPAYYIIANNPGKGIYQLSIQSPLPVQLSVSDLSGKKLITKRVGPGAYQLDISRYPAGIYLLQLQKDNEIFTEKLIKQ
ncbi:MAG: T9SS type A sorting domain-containing protein [Ginsengibacter sp.]